MNKANTLTEPRTYEEQSNQAGALNMGMPVLVSLSSVGVSRPVGLDWGATPRVSFSVTGSSSGSFSYVVEGSLDDIQQVASANVAWTALSSATTANSSLNLYQGPLAAIRLNASAISSATLTLRILQEMP